MESQRSAVAGMTTSSKKRSNGFRRGMSKAPAAESAVVISYARPCLNEAKKSRSTVSTITSVDDQDSLRRCFRRAVLADHLTVTTIRTAKRLAASKVGFTGGHLPC